MGVWMIQETLLVLGGTGSCGEHFVQHALDSGYRVRVLSRNPKRITLARFLWAEHPKLETFQADLTDSEALRKACEGVEAVVSLAGPPLGAKESMMPQAIRNTVEGMRAQGVTRLIVQAGGFVKLKGEDSNVVERYGKGAFGFFMKEKATFSATW